ncbi:tryptophan-rich sensory protein, partial [Francisella tularensis subsp. holarctica]
INNLAGYLLVPYLLWIRFAWILNFSYAVLN